MSATTGDDLIEAVDQLANAIVADDPATRAEAWETIVAFASAPRIPEGMTAEKLRKIADFMEMFEPDNPPPVPSPVAEIRAWASELSSLPEETR